MQIDRAEDRVDVKKRVLSFLNARFPDWLASLGVRAYSQEGEDLVLARLFADRDRGFFVDVGAHHPYRFSNTYLLYRRGWRGVNIDAMPGSMEKFRRFRPGDTNVEVGIGFQSGVLTYHQFNDPALNTFDPDLAAARNRPPYRIIGRVELRVRPLADVLAETVPAGQPIDLMTIDVEGRDLDVLRSNDWERFRPSVVLVEVRNRFHSSPVTDPSEVFLAGQGYEVAAMTFNTLFLVDRRK